MNGPKEQFTNDFLWKANGTEKTAGYEQVMVGQGMEFFCEQSCPFEKKKHLEGRDRLGIDKDLRSAGSLHKKPRHSA